MERTPLLFPSLLCDAIPGAVLIAIEDSGHLTPIKEPHAVSAACAIGHRFKK